MKKVPSIQVSPLGLAASVLHCSTGSMNPSTPA